MIYLLQAVLAFLHLGTDPGRCLRIGRRRGHRMDRRGGWLGRRLLRDRRRPPDGIVSPGPANKGKVIDRGLWRYTRHPNYFGDACVWWGIFLVAAEHWPGVLTVFSPPLIMTLLLTRGQEPASWNVT